MLTSGFSGSSFLNVTPGLFGGRSSKRVGAVFGWSQPASASTPAAAIIADARDTCYLAGRIRMAWPPPGASTIWRREAAVTVRLEIATGRGLVSQFAPGPSAYTSAT